jgi:hypothetical protein
VCVKGVAKNKAEIAKAGSRFVVIAAGRSNPFDRIHESNRIARFSAIFSRASSCCQRFYPIGRQVTENEFAVRAWASRCHSALLRLLTTLRGVSVDEATGVLPAPCAGGRP